MSFLLLLCHCVVCVWHHWFLELFLIILPHKEMIRIMWCFYTTFSSSLCSLCYLRVPLCIYWCSSFDWLASQFLNILRLANCSKGFYSELNKFLRGNFWTTIITKKKKTQHKCRLCLMRFILQRQTWIRLKVNSMNNMWMWSCRIMLGENIWYVLVM